MPQARIISESYVPRMLVVHGCPVSLKVDNDTVS